MEISAGGRACGAFARAVHCGAQRRSWVGLEHVLLEYLGLHRQLDELQVLQHVRFRSSARQLEALTPKDRRTPQLPNATPSHVVEDLLTLAVIEPTLGCRQYADRLAERGYTLGKTTVQKHLVDHGLGRRSQRVARAAAITAATTGLSTDAARNSEPFGFCHYSPAPGHLVAMDSFYIGNLKGVGKVYQLTAIDVATRWAVMLIVYGPVTASHTIRFTDHVIRAFRRLGVDVRCVLTDNGPEYIAAGFRAHLAAKSLTHVRIPPRSPNHNAVVERFQGTALQECWRPAFHRRRYSSIRQLQAEADEWLNVNRSRRFKCP